MIKIKKMWTLNKPKILVPKGKKIDIMISDFLFQYFYLNLAVFLFEKQKKLDKQICSLKL